MNRTGNDAFSELVRKHESKPVRFRCKIIRVGYTTRRLQVVGYNYSGPKKVGVQQGINIGTVEHPKVFPNDQAIVERINGKWLATSIKPKKYCTTPSAPPDIEVEIDSVTSYSVQDFGSTLTPLDIMIPPWEPLGEISLPDIRFPGGATFLCGVPPCPDCGDMLPGMVPVITAGGCWQWDFRGGCCLGRPLSKSQYTVDTRTTPQGAAMAVAGIYNYIAVQSGLGTDKVFLHVVSSADPENPVEIGLLDTGIDGGVDSVAEFYDLAVIGPLLVTSIKYGSTPDFWGWAAIDVSDPTDPVPFLGGATNINSEHLGHWIELFQVASTVYLVTNFVDGGGAVNPQGYYLVNAATALTVAEIGTSNPIDVFDYGGGFLYGVGDTGGFLVHDVTVPATPTARGSIGSAVGTGQCIRAAGDYVWIGDSASDELVGVDVTDPDAPTVISTTSLTDQPMAIDICGDFVYISLADGTVVAYDVTDPTSPVQPVLDTLTIEPLVKMTYVGVNQVHVLGYDNGTAETTLAIMRS